MEELNYYPLFIIFVIAWAVPFVLSWLEWGKIPKVIVEITMGVIIGPYVLDLMDDTPYMGFLASTGFLFLIFLAGLEIDVNKIIGSFPKGRIKMIDLATNTFLLAIFIYFGSLLLAVPFVYGISFFVEMDLAFFTLLLPTVALSITVPILKADGELKQKFGQIMLMEGAIATIVSIILLSVYAGVYKSGFNAKLLYFVIIFAVFIITYVLGQRLLKQRTFKKLLYRLEHAASQIRVRGTVLLLLLFVIVAQSIDTELIMGAFFAGVLLSLFVKKERSALLFKLDGMSYGFFIPIFFIMVGVNLDLSSLKQFNESIPFILILTVGFYFVQIVPSLIMSKLFGFKKALSGGILNTSRLGLTIAAAQVGLSLGVISTANNAGIVASAIITSLTAPLLYKVLHKSGEEFNNIILIGGSRASLQLAERLDMHNLSCLTLLQKEEMMSEFDDKSLAYQKVREFNDSLFNYIELRTGDLVIVLTESNVINQQLTKYVKNELNHSKIITRKQSVTHELVDDQNEIKLVDHDELIANHIEDMVMRPNTVDTLSTSFDVFRIEEIKVTNAEINRELVKDIAFPPSGSLVIQRRDGEVFIPHGNTHILTGDMMTVIGNGIALEDFRKIFEGKA